MKVSECLFASILFYFFFAKTRMADDDGNHFNIFSLKILSLTLSQIADMNFIFFYKLTFYKLYKLQTFHFIFVVVDRIYIFCHISGSSSFQTYYLFFDMYIGIVEEKLESKPFFFARFNLH